MYLIHMCRRGGPCKAFLILILNHTETIKVAGQVEGPNNMN